MITAVDSNILIDIFLDDPRFGKTSARRLAICLNEGAVVICGVVLAEVMPLFPSNDKLDKALAMLNIKPVSLVLQTFVAAGISWKEYRRDGGRKNRMVADFLIGAHALVECDRLLTRDRGFYRQYFKKLNIIEPH